MEPHAGKMPTVKELSRAKIVIWHWRGQGKGKRHTLVGLLELRLEGEVLDHFGGFLVSVTLLLGRVDQC